MKRNVEYYVYKAELVPVKEEVVSNRRQVIEVLKKERYAYKQESSNNNIKLIHLNKRRQM